MMMMTMSQSSNFNKAFANPDVDWSVFENADRYLLRDDSAWITRLSKDFWWNLERMSEMITTGNTTSSSQLKPYPEQNLPTRKIVGQRSAVTRPIHSTHIPEKLHANQDNEYNPFQSNISFDNQTWTNLFQQAIPWQ